MNTKTDLDRAIEVAVAHMRTAERLVAEAEKKYAGLLERLDALTAIVDDLRALKEESKG